MNNPLSGTDPTGYCSTGSHIKGKDVAGCSVVFDAGSGGSGKKKSEAKVTSNGGNNYTASFQLDNKTTLEVDFKINNVGSQGAIASGSGVGGYTDGELAKMGFSAGTRFINDFGDWRARPGGVSIEQDQAALAEAAGVAGFAGAVLLTGGALTAYIGAEATGLVFIAASGGDMVDVALARLPVANSGSKLLPYSSETRFFKGDEAVQHFEKHSSELMQAFGRTIYNLKNYVGDANHVIKEGTFVPEMNGYVRLIGGEGSAKYGFVGLDRTTGNITTFHVKSVSELSKKAPSLGFSK
ncbi:hypothetical protein L2744_21220 [Shewanella profunda]|nr:hypothetical protein [Shewanella profunda]